MTDYSDYSNYSNYSSLILRINSYIFSQSPEILFDVFRVPVLKKLRQTNFKNQREIIVKRGYHRMFYDEIAKEVERWDKL